MARRYHWIEPRRVGIAIAAGTSILLVLAAERHHVESLIGLVAALLMGLHMALSPHIFRVGLAAIRREEARDRYPLLSTFSFLLLGAYLIIEYIIT